MLKQDVTETVFLVGEAKGGNRDALNRLFERFAPFVRRVVRIRLGPAPSRDDHIDDLVQDALLRALEGLERFGGRPENDFRAWIACCARCAVFDDYKRVRALKRGGAHVIKSFSDWGSLYLTSSVFRGRLPTPSEAAIGAESEEKLVAALLSLDERHRKIIVYRKVCDMSYHEISRELHLKSEANARTLCHRALHRLREAMSG